MKLPILLFGPHYSVYKYFAFAVNKSVLNWTQVCQLHWKTQLHKIFSFSEFIVMNCVSTSLVKSFLSIHFLSDKQNEGTVPFFILFTAFRALSHSTIFRLKVSIFQLRAFDHEGWSLLFLAYCSFIDLSINRQHSKLCKHSLTKKIVQHNFFVV